MVKMVEYNGDNKKGLKANRPTPRKTQNILQRRNLTQIQQAAKVMYI